MTHESFPERLQNNPVTPEDLTFANLVAEEVYFPVDPEDAWYIADAHRTVLCRLFERLPDEYVMRTRFPDDEPISEINLVSSPPQESEL